MLLLCTQDMYTNNLHKKIFTSGKIYSATYGKYKENLLDYEIENIFKNMKSYAFMEELLEQYVIMSENDYGENWLIHVFKNEKEYDMKNQFKNNNFAQISTFYGGIFR